MYKQNPQLNKKFDLGCDWRELAIRQCAQSIFVGWVVKQDRVPTTKVVRYAKA